MPISWCPWAGASLLSEKAKQELVSHLDRLEGVRQHSSILMLGLASCAKVRPPLSHEAPQLRGESGV
jgi:hypothetical protein